MIKNFLKALLGLALCIGICLLGLHCLGITAFTPKEDGITIKLVLGFIGFYYIIARPVCAYWCDKVWDFLGIDK